MTASGRERTLKIGVSPGYKRPLWRKADIKRETPEIESENVRFTLGSGHSAKISQKGR